jgi:biotin carboxylase
VPVPAGRTALSFADAAAFADANGYPVVLKQAWNASGHGVRRCGDRAALARAFSELSARPPPWRLVLRRLAGRDWRPPRQPVDVQAFIPGTPAMSCAVAREGKVVAVLCALTRQTTRPEGQASVVTLCRHAGMEEATAAMVAAFGASGFIAFDFIIAAETGRAVLIECNPRPIQVAHLGPRIGVDLVAALAHAFAGTPSLPPPPEVLREETIAFFPQEWLRDSGSPHFAAAFHDVPWDEPALVEAALGGQPPPLREGRGGERI